jgi:hypothetical protein
MRNLASAKPGYARMSGPFYAFSPHRQALLALLAMPVVAACLDETNRPLSWCLVFGVGVRARAGVAHSI